MFHDVKDITWFDNIVKFLNKFYKIISIEDVDAFYNQNTTYESTCVLSFDDGNKSFYDVVFPVLKELKIPAVLYVSPKRILERRNFWFQEIRGHNSTKLKEIITDYLSLDNHLIKDFDNNAILKCLKIKQIEEIISIYKRETKELQKNCLLVTPEQLIEMHKSDFVTIGAHTQNHPILTNENDQSSEYEISRSINELSSLLDNEVKYFAYPNGIKNLDYTQREINTLNRNAISVTVSTNINHYNKTDNRQEVPRIGISQGSNLHILGKIILGRHWEKLKKRDNEYNQRLKTYAILKDYGKL